MKGKSSLILLLLLIMAIGLGALSYFGIGSSKIMGVQNIKQGLDLQGGVSIVYEADKESPTVDEMNAAEALIRGRLDRKGYTEAEVAKEGENRLRVDIPAVENAEEVISQIGQTAMLYFKDEAGNVLLTGEQVANARKEVSSKGQGMANEIAVALEFTEEGKKLFEEATAANVGKTIIISIDDAVLSAPNVNEKISGGNAIITGAFTAEEAEELAASIRAGALPFALKIIYMNTVGAKLGAQALQTSVFAGIVGTVLVLLFMLIIYRMLGITADIALCIYIGLLLVTLSLFGITLTLPGIAGIVLSVGMAVDANVVIFERIKEELHTGKTLKAAINAGFQRAFPAILDGNVTTLIAAAVLFWLGTGPVKGFAQTLSIGVLLSMFTALIITRLLVNSFVNVGIKNPNLYCARLGGK